MWGSDCSGEVGEVCGGGDDWWGASASMVGGGKGGDIWGGWLSGPSILTSAALHCTHLQCDYYEAHSLVPNPANGHFKLLNGVSILIPILVLTMPQ